MYSFALDESGDFEKNSEQKDPVMIAGILYDDADDPYDAYNERMRVLHYLQLVCERTGASFPQDLHANNGLANLSRVRTVKNEIADTLKDFIRKGTYREVPVPVAEGKIIPRSGQYYVFAEVKSTAGIRSRISHGTGNGKEPGNLLADNYADNLYLHMTANAVNRVLFHNPWVDEIDSVSLYFPTRSMPVSKLSSSEEYLGFFETKDSEKEWYAIVSTDYYRTVMERELERIGRRSFNIRYMLTTAIPYVFAAEDASMQKYAFLYLADYICSRLNYIRQGTTPGEWLLSFEAWCEDYFGADHSIVFGYDDVDLSYERALEACRRGQLYDALEIIWEAENTKSEFSDWYHGFWFARLKDRIQGWEKAEDLAQALVRLDQKVRTSNLNQQKMLFLFRILEQAGDRLKQADAQNSQALFCLYNAGISVYNHLGNVQLAEDYYKKCMRSAGQQDVETILRVRSRMVVSLMDRFAFTKAQEIAGKNLALGEKMDEIRDTLLQNERENSSLAILLSQYAQTLACTRSPEAAVCFKRALQLFRKDTPDYNITLSYYLHYLLDTGQYDRYHIRAKEYFGKRGAPAEQFSWLL